MSTHTHVCMLYEFLVYFQAWSQLLWAEVLCSFISSLLMSSWCKMTLAVLEPTSTLCTTCQEELCLLPVLPPQPLCHSPGFLSRNREVTPFSHTKQNNNRICCPWELGMGQYQSQLQGVYYALGAGKWRMGGLAAMSSQRAVEEKGKCVFWAQNYMILTKYSSWSRSIPYW